MVQVFVGDIVMFHSTSGDRPAIVCTLSTDQTTAELSWFDGQSLSAFSATRGTGTYEWQPVYRGILLS